ncbi:carbamate kinase [Secundilactobacillus mixtipabuli]|uniref:Carbamate kinase n=1 Tax=Secundilactobacillus mixtipabuli TaxID=1435342 RepID=A0A1Z5I9K3_9LACO|nr:carbamate kinase [Secundilactobacillus mixtipabuli]GAW98394.1 carbamate kinase [Secundilactobacillus mixtipabuli]
MTKRRVVVALGGNAILSKDASAQAQQEALRKTAKYLVQFVKQGDELVISHGNGPQVGNLLLQQAAGSTDTNPAMPIDTAVAMTQGSIGYWLQNAMREELTKAGLNKSVATVVTQVEVSETDHAFSDPSKPIGPFYSKEVAEQQHVEHPNYKYVEDAGRGYRRVVPSPKPVNVVEADVVEKLVDGGVIPVSVGGGGVPVVRVNDRLEGREAVIDKDFASEKLAEQIHADMLIILTAVDHVFVNFNTPQQKSLTNVTVPELKQYIQEGQFAKGSMLPKVQAAIDFVENTKHGKTVITSLENIGDFLARGEGTVINQIPENIMNK